MQISRKILVRTTLISTIFVFAIVVQINAQENLWTIYGQIGVGTYGMSDMKTMQSQLEAQYSDVGLPVKIIGNFPPYANYQVQILRSISTDFAAGIHLGYASTGSRVSYRDYSGHIQDDLLLDRISGGVVLRRAAGQIAGRKLDFSTQISVSHTRFDIREDVRLLEKDLSLQTFSFVSYGLAIEPGLNLVLTEHPINIDLYTGYQLDYHFAFFLKGNRDAKLTDDSGNKIKPGWSGARLAILIGYSF